MRVCVSFVSTLYYIVGANIREACTYNPTEIRIRAMDNGKNSMALSRFLITSIIYDLERALIILFIIKSRYCTISLELNYRSE